MRDKKFTASVLIPAFIFLGIFVVIPLIYALGISFYDYNPARIQNPFVGLANYKKMLEDEVMVKAILNTLKFSCIGVCANIVLTLFVAQSISSLRSSKLQTVFKTILFIPCVAPIVGTSVIWKYSLLETDGGVLNTIIKWVGGSPKNWFATSTALLLIIVVYTLWTDMGYNVILFSAGFNSVPQEFEEAAKIDGANRLQRFFFIRLPLIRRTFAFVFIMTLADYMKMFAQFKVLVPSGGVDNCVMVLTNYVYKCSFVDHDMGYASAVAMVLFVIIFIIVGIQNRMMRSDWGYE